MSQAQMFARTQSRAAPTSARPVEAPVENDMETDVEILLARPMVFHFHFSSYNALCLSPCWFAELEGESIFAFFGIRLCPLTLAFIPHSFLPLSLNFIYIYLFYLFVDRRAAS